MRMTLTTQKFIENGKKTREDSEGEKSAKGRERESERARNGWRCSLPPSTHSLSHSLSRSRSLTPSLTVSPPSSLSLSSLGLSVAGRGGRRSRPPSPPLLLPLRPSAAPRLAHRGRSRDARAPRDPLLLLRLRRRRRFAGRRGGDCSAG